MKLKQHSIATSDEAPFSGLTLVKHSYQLQELHAPCYGWLVLHVALAPWVLRTSPATPLVDSYVTKAWGPFSSGSSCEATLLIVTEPPTHTLFFRCLLQRDTSAREPELDWTLPL